MVVTCHAGNCLQTVAGNRVRRERARVGCSAKGVRDKHLIALAKSEAKRRLARGRYHGWAAGNPICVQGKDIEVVGVLLGDQQHVNIRGKPNLGGANADATQSQAADDRREVAIMAHREAGNGVSTARRSAVVEHVQNAAVYS